MGKTAAQRRNHVERVPVPAIKRTRGRPSSFTSEMEQQACFMARHGATDAEIALELGVATSTLYLWMAQVPEFSEAIKAGKEHADDRMEASLYRRGIGFHYKAQKLHQGNVVSITEYLPGDVGAIKHWLGNRRRKDWNNEISIVVPDSNVEAPADDDRQLALAALAMLAELNQGPVIEHRSNEEPEDGEETDATGPRVDDANAQRQRRSRRAAAPQADQDFDPDFDS